MPISSRPGYMGVFVGISSEGYEAVDLETHVHHFVKDVEFYPRITPLNRSIYLTPSSNSCFGWCYQGAPNRYSSQLSMSWMNINVSVVSGTACFVMLVWVPKASKLVVFEDEPLWQRYKFDTSFPCHPWSLAFQHGRNQFKWQLRGHRQRIKSSSPPWCRFAPK